MKLILTDDVRCCPAHLPSNYRLVKVDAKSLQGYNGNNDVEIVLCTRALARVICHVNLPSCKMVHLFSVGYDNVDVSFFKEREIALCNAAGIYDNVLAEYVVYAMLLYAKRFRRSIKNRLFRPFRNYHYMTELAGKTVGIMGCGRIGTAISKHLSGFNMTIVGYAKNTTEKEGFGKIYHKENIGEFFSSCDFVVNTLPHDKSTIGLIDSNLLGKAKRTMTLVNIGRDSIFAGNDFYNWLKRNKDATAILDMFDIIPNPITNKYRRLSNVLVMPRVAAISQESESALRDLLSENMQLAIDGKELKNRIV